MSATRSKVRLVQLAAIPLFALGLTSLVALPLSPAPAHAEEAENEEEAELAKKTEWQDRYRVLRTNAVRMQDNAAKMRRAYGLAQHANYPRGNAREDFRKRVEKAERDGERYQAELAEFEEEARRNGIPPGWLAEVEDEPIDRGFPAELDEESEDDGGRNPLYADEDDEESGDEEEDRDEDDEEEADERDGDDEYGEDDDD
jgi:hypothetical protein